MAYGTDRALPTAEEWARTCGLKQHGRGRWKGPCPLCGGEDRFHVEHAGRRTLVGCRGCLDGLADADKRKRFGALLRQVFPERYGQADPRPPAPRTPPRRATPPPQTSSRADEGASNAVSLWAPSVAAECTPARAYLAARFAWPPDGTGPDLPPDVRWLPAREWPPSRKGRPGVPHGAAGGIVFAYRRRGILQAVDVEALTRGGKRLSRRWRRTVGPKQGSVFAAGLEGGSPIVLAEGALDALACRWLHPEAECLAMGGTAGVAAWAPRLSDRRPVLIEADGDAPGRRAAIEVQTLLLACGYACRIDSRGTGDPAYELAVDLMERASVLEAQGNTREDADRLAWLPLLGAHPCSEVDQP